VPRAVRVRDTVAGALTLVLGLAVATYAWTFPPMPGQPVGPGLFPTLVGAGLALLGLALVVAARRRAADIAGQVVPWTRHPHLVRNFVLVVGDLLFYAVAVDGLGFLLTSILFLSALLMAFGAQRRVILPVAVAVTLAVHVGFYTVLRVPLPWGVLQGIAW
jgi:putative tricarboxylic transport membrane protein